MTRNADNHTTGYLYGNSDGKGGSGHIPDCGYAIETPTACPGDCSSHGDCDSSTFACDCYEGWWGPDCSLSFIFFIHHLVLAVWFVVDG